MHEVLCLGLKSYTWYVAIENNLQNKIGTGVNWIKRGRRSESSLAGDSAAYYLGADSHWNLRRQ